MAKKISQLTQATEVKSDDVTVIVQDGETKKLPLNMMVTKQDIENKKVAGLAKLDEIEATYENDTYTPTITVKNKSSVKTGEGDEVDYSANVMDGHAKSAILTGQTLVNLFNVDDSLSVEISYSRWKYQKQVLNLIGGNKYYVYFFNKLNNLPLHIKPINTAGEKGAFNVEANTGKVVTLDSTITNAIGYYYFKDGWTGEESKQDIIDKCKILFIEYREGMENWDIPYFEGMQSVKMPVLTTTGKNLLNYSENFEVNSSWYGQSLKTSSAIIVDNKSNLHIKNDANGVTKGATYSINVPKNTVLNFGYEIIENSENSKIHIFIHDDNKSFLYGERNNTKNFITYNSNSNETLNVSYMIENIGEVVILPFISTATTYEPYKSNILTTSEEVELRGIGEIRDELNLLTGELTQRMGEVVLDGSEDWKKDGNTGYCLTMNDLIRASNYQQVLTSDRLPIGGLYNGSYTTTTLSGYTKSSLYPNQNWLYIVGSEFSTIDELKTWLSQNPTTVQYRLATESIKTVDLTVVDQDNQPTQLGTFENVTHVSLESAGLIPEVEMEVATKLLEDTVFNLTNAFNTLYPTAAKPVVDGTLYGQTLVNLATQKSGRFNGTRFLRIPLSYLLNSNTNYFVNFILKESTLTDGVTCRFKNTSTGTTIGAIKSSGIIATNANVADILEIYIDNTDDVANGLDAIIDDIMVIEYQEGMENWDIPYFEGMQSVQAPGMTMTGKNLINRQTMNGGYIDANGDFQANSTDLVSDFIKISPTTNYTYKVFTNKTYDMRFTFFDENKSMIERTDSFRISNGRHKTYSSPSNAYYVRVHSNEFSNIGFDAGISLVMGDTPLSSYEPYKSISLSTPSDLELRKVGEVQDEVNVMTGEVVERFDDRILNGSEYWDIVNNTFRSSIIKDKVIKLETQADKDRIVISCDRYPSRTYNEPWLNNRGNFISLTIDGNIVIKDESFTTVNEWKEYLSQNPLTIKFVLATPTTKTVDLTVVNQDGNKTKLRTFDDMTHVLLNSEGVPMSKASLTVRTKIPSASSTSLLMDDISTNQQQLEATVDEQSNNVDATMIATTEIYEETL